MICYMLIMNMPLWMTVYLRNKLCLFESQQDIDIPYVDNEEQTGSSSREGVLIP